MRLGVWLTGLLLLWGQGIAEAALQVRVDGDRLTLRAEQAPLREILQAIADVAHISLRLNAPLADPITVQFTQRPLLEALDWLLRDQSMLIRYTRERGAVRVEEVQVLASSPPSGRGGTMLPAKDAGVAEPPAPEAEAPPEITLSPDASPTERIEAAFVLAQDGQAETGQAILVDLLRTNEKAAVREEALMALTALATVPLEPVATAALTDPEPSVRLQAIARLGDMAKAEPGAREALERAAQQEQEEDLRETARAILEDLPSDNPAPTRRTQS